MKKILLIILLFCCNEFILVAQEIQSNLTLITTDLMNGEVRNQYIWSNVQYSLLRFHQPPAKAIEIMVDPGDGSGTGGNNGTGTTVYCKIAGTTGNTKFMNTNTGIALCYECKDGSWDCVGELVAVQPTGGSGNSNDPFNWSSWGSLGWGNLGSYFGTGFLNPPANGPIGGGFIGSYGGGATPNPKGNIPHTPPPTNPVDDPNGGTDNPSIKKDTTQFTLWDCDSSKIARGIYASDIWKQSDTAGTDVKRLRDSAANGIYESSIQIVKSNNKHITKNFFTSTSGINVTPPLPNPGDTIKGGAHCHQDQDKDGTGTNGNSPIDYFRLLDMHKKYPTYDIDFITAYDGSEWAITISDSTNATLFATNNNTYSIIDSTGENKNRWSGTKINPVSGKTYFDDFFAIGNKLFDKGYPLSLLTTLANMIMIDDGILKNSGIKVLMKVGDSFKELSFEEKTDPITEEKTYTIKICK